MGPLRRRSFICCQACVFHISAWRPTPMTVTSFSSFACWRRLAGSRMRPCLSGDASTAVAYRKRCTSRDFTMLFSDRSAEMRSHSSSGNATRQSSSQRVTMKVPPMASRNLGGKLSLPLSSMA